MVNTNIVAPIPLWVYFCGKAAPIASIVVFMAPIPTIRQISKDKTVGNLPLLPYTSMIANSFMWTSYGLLKMESKIYAPNAIGLLLGIWYFVQFIKYTPTQQSATYPGSIRDHQKALLAIVMCTGYVIQFFSSPQNADWLGTIAVLFCILLFASPLAALRVVLELKSAKSIPLPFTLATVLNCFLWSVVGILELHDIYVIVPNVLGLGFGLTQLLLKFIYRSGGGGSSTSSASTLPL